ncbi:TPA: hypothetical protein ACPZUA_003902 [Yersinia enterocolitica]
MSRTIEALITALKAAAQEEIMFRESSDTSDQWQDEATPENVLRLVEALSAKQAEPISLKSAIERFEEYNIGFPVTKFKADFVISWCLVNLIQPPSSPVVPEGWKLVPKEATLAMLTLLGFSGSFDSMQYRYANMLAAAPEKGNG